MDSGGPEARNKKRQPDSPPATKRRALHRLEENPIAVRVTCVPGYWNLLVVN
jgi:hypothetical protein